MTCEEISHFSRKACKKAGLCYPKGDFPVQGNSRDIRSSGNATIRENHKSLIRHMPDVLQNSPQMAKGSYSRYRKPKEVHQ